MVGGGPRPAGGGVRAGAGPIQWPASGICNGPVHARGQDWIGVLETGCVGKTPSHLAAGGLKNGYLTSVKGRRSASGHGRASPPSPRTQGEGPARGAKNRAV